METLTPQQFEMAYRWWYQSYKFKFEDSLVSLYLSSDMIPYGKHKMSWIHMAREALFLSTGKVAEKTGIPRQNLIKLEENECNGTITLKSLARVAEAMDCELVYAIRPKKRRRFSEIIWQVLVKESIGHHWVKSRPENRKSNALAAIAKTKMHTPEFCRKYGWSKRV